MSSAISNGAGKTAFQDIPVDSLSTESQEDLLLDLLREVYRRNPGEGVIPLVNRDGEWLGNLVAPSEPAAAADRLYAQMPPETRHAIMKPLLDVDFDDTHSEDEVRQILNPDSPV